MHLADRYQSCEHVRCLFWIRLMDHTFVTLTGSTRFIRINARNDQNLVCYFVLYFAQAKKIIADRILIISRTWTNDRKKFI